MSSDEPKDKAFTKEGEEEKQKIELLPKICTF